MEELETAEQNKNCFPSAVSPFPSAPTPLHLLPSDVFLLTHIDSEMESGEFQRDPHITLSLGLALLLTELLGSAVPSLSFLPKHSV